MAFIGVSSLQQHSLVLLISCCYHRIVFASCLSISYFSLFLCLNFWPLYFTAALRHPGGNDPLPGGAGRLHGGLHQRRAAPGRSERVHFLHHHERAVADPPSSFPPLGLGLGEAAWEATG